MTKLAFITGITGQDGSYLAELLLTKGYQVHGLIRRGSSFNTPSTNHLNQKLGDNLFLHQGDLTHARHLKNLVLELQPDEIYNLGAQSHVQDSFDSPERTLQATGAGALNALEAARLLNESYPTRFYQASSSEMYGQVTEAPQNENTPFHPLSPYACAKAYAFHQTVNYRQAYGLFACNGILFNHESPRRAETFVTRKITRAAARIKLGLQTELYLGNLDARRDWGYAKDYVEAMWLMLQQDTPDDFVIATGQVHSIRDFLSFAFQSLDLSWQDYVQIDPQLLRPAEVRVTQGDASKAKRVFGWQPKVHCQELAEIMVRADLELAYKEAQQLSHSSASANLLPTKDTSSLHPHQQQ